MKNMAKFLSTLLVLLMLLTFVAGCQQTMTTGSTTTATTVTTTEPTTAEPTLAPQSEPVIMVVRGIADNQNKTDNEKVRQRIIDESGIDFDIIAIPDENWTAKINLHIAGGTTFDAFSLAKDNGNWSLYLDKGAIIPITELYEKYGTNIKMYMTEEGMKSCVSADGELYALPRQELFTLQGVPVIRKEWLEKLQMKMPNTMAELEAYFEAVKTTDLNGNNQQDEVPLICFDNLVNSFKPYFLGFGGERYIDSDGTVQPWYTHPATWSLLSKMQDWYSKDYVYKEYATAPPPQLLGVCGADRVGMGTGVYNAPLIGSMAILRENPDFAINYIPVPHFSDIPAGGSDQWYGLPKNPAGIAFSKTGKNPERAMMLLDWIMADHANYMLASSGIEGEHFNYSGTDKKSFTSIAGSSDKYAGIFNFMDWYDLLVFPEPKPAADDLYGVKRHELRLEILNNLDKYGATIAIDYFIPYKMTGTKAENLTTDNEDIITEALAKVIMGEYDEAAWNATVDDVMMSHGDILSEVWTEQYHSFIGK
jgi:putative aldouronate transport system substrate-binding protein